MRKRGLWITLAVWLLCSGASYQHTGPYLLPDPVATPGKVRPLSARMICTTLWWRDARHVTEKMKAQAYKNYRATKQQNVCCEIDHLISRELGGADVLENLWPQPWPQARKKDRLENKAHRLVCAGTHRLPDIQDRMAENWVELYREIFGEHP